MTRDDAASYLGARFSAYLAAVSRGVSDAPGALGEVIDDALRALGYAEADLSTAEAANQSERTDWTVQLVYRALLQLSRDLGAVFDVSTGGDSFRLSQMRVAVEKDLASAEAAVLARFGTTDVLDPDDTSGGIVTVDTNYLDECWSVA